MVRFDNRDAGRAAEVASLLKLTAHDLVGFGIADAIVPDDIASTVDAVGAALAGAQVGDRYERLDRATRNWLAGGPAGS